MSLYDPIVHMMYLWGYIYVYTQHAYTLTYTHTHTQIIIIIYMYIFGDFNIFSRINFLLILCYFYHLAVHGFG